MVVKRGYIYHLMLLAALGAYVLDTVRDGIQYTMNATERMDNLRRRKVMEERVSVFVAQFASFLFQVYANIAGLLTSLFTQLLSSHRCSK